MNRLIPMMRYFDRSLRSLVLGSFFRSQNRNSPKSILTDTGSGKKTPISQKFGFSEVNFWEIWAYFPEVDFWEIDFWELIMSLHHNNNLLIATYNIIGRTVFCVEGSVIISYEILEISILNFISCAQNLEDYADGTACQPLDERKLSTKDLWNAVQSGLADTSQMHLYHLGFCPVSNPEESQIFPRGRFLENMTKAHNPHK